ncbi:MAG: hypothetical protein JXM70_29015 [Pirellulales bacterium]|nr:hypothetical protein [Pirellulales bacterium]
MSKKHIGLILVSLVFALLFVVQPSFAQFDRLLNFVPADANTVTVLNLEKMLNSVHGMNQHWKEKLAEKAADRPLEMPARATRVVLASRIDLEYMKPLWELAIVELKDIPTIKEIAKAEGGSVDEIAGMPAVRTSRDAYVIHLSRDTFAVFTPADRQKVTRWLSKALKQTEPAFSPFLKKRTAVADSGGTEMIMAMDLADVIVPSTASKKLKTMETLSDKTVNYGQLSEALADIRGVAMGVRIGEKPFGQLVVDFEKDVSIMAPFAKPLLLEILAKQGAMIDDFQQWQDQVSNNTVSLKGDISDLALRRLLMLIEPPTPDMKSEKAASQASPGDTSTIIKAMQNHFDAIQGYLKDLKLDKKKMKTWGQLAMWMEKYAAHIQKLPLLNVDPDMIDYGEKVDYDLRKAAYALRGMGIKSGVEQAQIDATNPSGVNVYGNRYGGRYGWNYGYGGGFAVTYNDNSAEKRAARYSTRAEGVNAARDIIEGIRNGTVEIRRKMTERYKVEF